MFVESQSAEHRKSRSPGAVEIGARIKQSRLENSMTQVELADLLRLSERSVAAYEGGEVIPYRYLKDLERALDMPVAWFLHGEDAVVGRDKQLQEILVEIRAVRRIVERIDKRG